MVWTIKRAEFIGGYDKMSRIPAPALPEVCFIGRSNVGKSSLINRLTGRNKLARVSSTPGRTQELNYFEIHLSAKGGGDAHRLHLVDMPGFGYGKISKEKREDLSLLTVQFIREREGLSAVCLLNDCRREPGREEIAIRDLAFDSGAPLLVVLTKLDKLSGNERKKQTSAIAEAYGLEPEDLLLTGERYPADDVWGRIVALME